MRTVLSLSLIAVFGLMVSCSGNHQESRTPTLNPVAPSNTTVKGIQGVITTNASGLKLIGDVVLYANGNTKITIDGVVASRDDIQPGMIIEAEGELVNDKQFDCTSITSYSLLTGKVESVDLEANTLQIAGQTVLVDDKSHLVSANEQGNNSVGAFQVGDSVTVCGFIQEDSGHCMATRIAQTSDSSATATFTVQGTISNLTGTTFKVGNQTVRLNNATTVTGTVANGYQAVACCYWVNGELYADWVTSQAPAANTNVQSVYGTMSNWDQYGYCFQLGGRGGCCGGIRYWVDYEEDDDYTALLASVSGTNTNLRVEGTVTRTGNTYRIKATKISK
jgi:hypothetical protein